eukprot:GFUD01039843.1.p1 GENE.GFUD01039843.1~~GFUD01039843.1.p1  ORF type:complete len:598 (+),score=146.62 GFUD01039843.1:42-1835(+)
MEDDILLIVGGTKHRANKSLLCQHSPYFLAMFQDHFMEENKTQIELHSVDPKSIKILIDWSSCTTLPLNHLSTQEVMDLLQSAGMLQFSSVQNICVEILCSRVDHNNCWVLMQFADLLSEEKFLKRIEKYILWNFETAVKSNEFTDVHPKILLRILKNEKLNVKNEMQVFRAVVTWVGKDKNNYEEFPELMRDSIFFDNLSFDNLILISEHDLIKNEEQLRSEIIDIIEFKGKREYSPKDDFQKLKIDPSVVTSMLKKGEARCLPIFPCVIGHKLNKHPIKDLKRTDEEELDDWNQMGVRASRYQDTHKDKHKTVCMFVWNPTTLEVESIGPVNNVQDGEVEASGFKVACSGIDLVLSGGEFSLGHSNWHKSVTKWNSLKRKWENVASMETVRRHHTMVIVNRVVYLLGGFGKHRIILDSVDAIDIDTGEQRECASLPVPMYRPAAAVFKGRIFVVGKKMASVYHPCPQNYWASLNHIGLPPDVEFDSAMASDSHIYLTSSHRRELFRFDPESKGPDVSLKMVGCFTKEANNTCIVNGVIYNFNSEEFDDERVVESFDTKTEIFKVLWKKEVPEWDFSPHYCLGCFPIVDYDIKTPS